MQRSLSPSLTSSARRNLPPSPSLGGTRGSRCRRRRGDTSEAFGSSWVRSAEFAGRYRMIPVALVAGCVSVALCVEYLRGIAEPSRWLCEIRSR